MASTILARADALMRRRRQTPEGDDVPVLTDTVDEDDIPVLIEAEAISAGAEQPAPIADAAEPSDFDPGLRPPGENAAPMAEDLAPAALPAQHELLIAELTRRIEQRVAAELPRLIEETVREVLAEQEMIAHQQSRG